MKILLLAAFTTILGFSAPMASATTFNLSGDDVTATQRTIRGFTETLTPFGTQTVGPGSEYIWNSFTIDVTADTIVFSRTGTGTTLFRSFLSGGMPLVYSGFIFESLDGGTPINAVSFTATEGVADNFVGPPTPDISFTDDTLTINFFNMSFSGNSALTIKIAGAPMPAVPLPPAMALSLGGLALLAGLRRRQRG